MASRARLANPRLFVYTQFGPSVSILRNEPMTQIDVGQQLVAPPGARKKPTTAPLSLLRILNMLDCVADSPDGCTLSDLSAATNAPKTSLISLLHGLVEGGYLIRSHRRYLLHDEAFRLAAKINGSRRLPDLNRAVLARLNEQTGEMIGVCVLTTDKQEIVVVESLEGRHTIRVSLPIGTRRPSYSSASGRALLAFLPKEELDDHLRRAKLERKTGATETALQSLPEILAAARETGVVVANEEVDDGMTCIAAPFFDNRGKAIGALTLSGPFSRVLPKVTIWSAMVRDAAKQLSDRRGYCEE